MPKVTISPTQRMNRAFLAALRYGQELRAEKDCDTAKLVRPGRERTYYRRVKAPENFTVAEARIMAQRYFNDRQLCAAFGVEYHGSTAE